MQPDAYMTNRLQTWDPRLDEQSTQALGDMPLQGGFLVKVKIVLRMVRPVLHILLFAGPAFLIALCCGARCAWWSGLLLTIAGESAQAALWSGFGWDDAADFLVNCIGIYLGIRMAGLPVFRSFHDWVLRGGSCRKPMQQL